MQRSSIEVGDMVKIDRDIYHHWGIYIGGGEIVHLAPEGSDDEIKSLSLAFQKNSKAEFKKDPLETIARNCSYYAANYLDHKYTVSLKFLSLKKSAEIKRNRKSAECLTQRKISQIELKFACFPTWLHIVA